MLSVIVFDISIMLCLLRVKYNGKQRILLETSSDCGIGTYGTMLLKVLAEG